MDRKSKPTKPHISVVVPAFNEEDYLPNCLKALLNQDLNKPYEILVVDNNSTDSTAQIAKLFHATLIKESRQGVIFSKQTGCMLAKGKIIAVLDADNIPPPHWLSSIEKLLSDNNISGVTGPYQIPKHAPWWGKMHNQILANSNQFFQNLTGQVFHLWGGSVAFRKKDFESFGGYNTNFSFTADEVLLRRDLQKIGKVIQHKSLTVTTSTRRFSRGAYYFFITFGVISYIGNHLYSSITKKPLPPPEDIRKEV